MQLGSSHDSQPRKLSAPKIIHLFKALAEVKFTGKVIWLDEIGTHWTLFYASGCIAYATGGKHLVRRWRRTLQLYHSQLQFESDLFHCDLIGDSSLELSDHAEYKTLATWTEANKISRQTAQGIIQNIFKEILFDLFKADKITYRLSKKDVETNPKSLFAVDIEEAFQSVYPLWQNWQASSLNQYCPDQAPVVRKPEEIQAKTNKQLYQVLITLLNGQNTLRDVAAKTQRDIFQITQALRAFIQLGFIDLIEVPDYSAPTKSIEVEVLQTQRHQSWPLVACVDDSLLVCQSMERIVKAGGYQFISVSDAQRAISTLLIKKPSIVFLDLVMPYTNGYEICSQLRKVSKFKEIPIIILSGNDGVVDQVRARLMGATDFVSKPVEPAIILSIIHKYLESPVPIYQ